MTQTVALHGVSIAFEEEPGTAQSIMFIHGNSASHGVWASQFGGALKPCRLIALDLPGHGESSRVPSYSVETLADAIVGVAQAVACEDAVFVGHSLGGHVLLEAAARLPKARGFVIFGTPPLGRPPRLDEAFLPSPALGAAFKAEVTESEIDTWASCMFRPGAAIPDLIAADIRRTDPRMRADVGQALASLAFVDEQRVVRDLAQPLAVLHGRNDAIVNLAYLQQLVAPTLWQGAVQVVDEAGHYLQIERPEVFSRLLREFVRA